MFAAIPMLIVFLILKIRNPKAPAIFKSERLTRYNRKFKCYKFRSMKPEWSGMTPEEAFIKMGKPELIKKYRKNGDYMKDEYPQYYEFELDTYYKEYSNIRVTQLTAKLGVIVDGIRHIDYEIEIRGE